MLKKCIVIMVMFALVAGAVFADTSVAGAIEARVNVYKGEFGDYTNDSGFDPYDGGFPKPTTGGEFGAAWMQLSGSSTDGTMGGLFRLRATDIMDGSLRYHRVFVWWRPFPQMRFFLGQDADGMFETGQLTSWAFHQGSESFLTVHEWDYWRKIFPGNWDTFGAALSFYLVPGLDINLVIPIGNPSGWPRHREQDVKRSSKIEQIYPGSLQLTVGYNIDDVGKIAFAWIGSGDNYFDDPKAFGKIALSFFSGALVEGLSFQVGASTDIQASTDPVTDADIDPAPVSVGAAVHFASGDFGVKFRIGTDIQVRDDGGLYLTTNVMPSYNLGIGKVCLDIGLSISKADNDADVETGFWINPYLKKGLSGGYFQVGLIITNNIGGLGSQGVKVDDITRVYFPLLLGFNF